MKKLKILSLLLVAASFSLMGLFLFKTNAAGSATYTLSPNSGSHDVNTSFTVTITENSGAETVNAIEADLSYDQSKLQYVSLDTSTSGFNIPASSSGGNGSVSIQRGAFTPVSGAQVVGTVTFKALVGSGSSPISFANSSLIYRSTDNADIWNHVSTGGTYSFTTPAAPPPPSSGGGTTTSSGGTTTTTKTSTSTSTTTKTSTSTTPTSTHTSTTSQASPVTSLGNNSFLVAIKVIDKHNQPVEGASVTLDSQSTNSDKTGMAGFFGITSGSHTVTVSSSVGKASGSINVDGTKPATELQQFTMTVKPASKILPLVLKYGVPAVILIVIVLFVLSKFRGRPSYQPIPVANVTPQTYVPPANSSSPMPSTIITPTNPEQPTVNDPNRL